MLLLSSLLLGSLTMSLGISIQDKMDKMLMAESREGPYVRDTHPHKHNPFKYLEDPMASVPIKHFQPKYQAKPMTYTHHQQGGHASLYDLMSYMIGEKYFKQQQGEEDIINFLDDSQEQEGEHEEQLPYQILENYGSYQKRRIPSAQYVCAHERVDTASDPLAGLSITRVQDAIEVMQSRRWQKLPTSRMFKKLFKYISGVNSRTEEVNMTTPVSTLHHVERRDYLGNHEIQEMCFYLPLKYQPDHVHEEDAGPAPRHAPLEAPQPIDDTVFLHTRPQMDVYVRRFGGFMMTQEQWEEQREALASDLIGKPHHDNEFFTVSYSSPFTMYNRKNEVWIQALEPGQPVIAAVVAEGHWGDEDSSEEEEDSEDN